MHESIGGALDYAEVAYIALAGIFVERDGTDCGGTGAEGDAQHLQIALQLPAFAGSSVLHYVHIIEFNLLAEHGHAEISLVQLGTRPLGEGDAHRILLLASHELPAPETGENLVDIELVAIDAGCDELSATASHLPLGGIAAVDYGYSLVLCHLIRNNNLLLSYSRPAPLRWSLCPRRCSRD